MFSTVLDVLFLSDFSGRIARRVKVQSVTTLFFRNDEHRSYSSFCELGAFILSGGDNPLLPLLQRERTKSEEAIKTLQGEYFQ